MREEGLVTVLAVADKAAMQPPNNVDGRHIAVVIVNYRTPDLTQRCLAALAQERKLLPGLRAMVVDGGSADSSAEELAKAVASPGYEDWVSFLPLPINGGFGWANNEAICRLMLGVEPPQFVHLLNPDAEVEPGAVAALARYLAGHPRTAAVGSQLTEPGGSLAGSAFRFPNLRSEFSRAARTNLVDRLLRVPSIDIASTTATEVDWTTGASVMIRVEALREAGLFDEGFFLYYDEVELMWRLRCAGWTIAFEPGSRVRHVGGASTGMSERGAEAPIKPRKPYYWYRSRARYFSLTRGRGFAAAAWFAWILGYAFWRVRHHLGLAPGAKDVERALRDQLAYSFPRKGDSRPAVRKLDSAPGGIPAWMKS
jgi:hypothetical protein